MLSLHDLNGLWRIAFDQQASVAESGSHVRDLLPLFTVYALVCDGRYAGISETKGATLSGTLSVGSDGETVDFESTWDLGRADRDVALPTNNQTTTISLQALITNGDVQLHGEQASYGVRLCMTATRIWQP